MGVAVVMEATYVAYFGMLCLTEGYKQAFMHDDAGRSEARCHNLDVYDVRSFPQI